MEVGDKFVLFDSLNLLLQLGQRHTTSNETLVHGYHSVTRIHGILNLIYKDLIHILDIYYLLSVPLKVSILGVTMRSMSATSSRYILLGQHRGIKKELRTLTETKITKICDIQIPIQ